MVQSRTHALAPVFLDHPNFRDVDPWKPIIRSPRPLQRRAKGCRMDRTVGGHHFLARVTGLQPKHPLSLRRKL